VSKVEIPYGYIEDDNIFLSPWGEQTVRKIGEVRDGDPEASIQYFQKKYQELQEKIDQLQQRIQEADNKGSFLMKLHHLKQQITEHDGLGDYAALEAQIQKNINWIEEIIEKNRVRNSEIKKSLLEELKAAVQIVNWKEATEKVNDIKARWIKTGNAEETIHQQLEDEFWSLIQDFFARKNAFIEDKKRLIAHYEETYKSLVEEAHALKNTPDRKEKIQELKRRWKENGNIPINLYKPLMSKFNKALKPPVINIKKQLEEAEYQLDAIEIIAKNSLPILKEVQQKLKGLRPFNPEEKERKQELFDRLFLMIEKNFLHNLANRKFRDFEEKPAHEQKKLKIQLVNELIERDRAELETYETNMEKFQSQDRSVSRMMDNKLTQQRQKIRIKEEILRELNS
jgi:hypothetical protein